MQAAAALAHPQDRVSDWLAEVERIADELLSLRPAAGRAVKSVLVAIVRKDEAQARRLVSVLTASINEG